MFKFNRRCTGHCCKAFILSWIDPDTILQRKEFLNKNLKRNLDTSDETLLEEIKILDMLIYLGNDPKQFEEYNKKVIPNDNFKDPINEWSRNHYYTCKHHCNITGNCLNYEDRPKMCKTFPNGITNWKGACEFKGCTKTFTLKEMIILNYMKIKTYIINKWRYKYKYKFIKLTSRCRPDKGYN
jgi:Fe-S-cluster containining protein